METAADAAPTEAEGRPSRWTRAVAGDSGALRALAGSYWYGVYAWWRRAGATDPAAATIACFNRWLTDGPPKPEQTGAGRLREWLRARLAELCEEDLELIAHPDFEISP